MPRHRRGGPRQRTLGDFFPTTTAQQRESQVRRDFKNARRKAVARHQQEVKKFEQAARKGPDAFHRQERTFSCVTLNVNGFGNREAHRTEIFAALRHEDAHGRHDVVCLQETHVDTDAIDYNRRLHARTWGFRSTDDCEPLSFWAPSTDKKGGVAVLIDPYGRLKDVRPSLQAAWSSHFMAVTGSYAGVKLLFMCVYAPHQRALREQFYRRLSALDLPKVDKLIVGGDFNCTLDSRLDRSWYRPVSDHESPALLQLLALWGLVDAHDVPDGLEHEDMADYYDATHTYRYTFGEGVEATARLDRWYVSAPLMEWIAAVEVWRTETQADHHAVRLHLRSPTDPVRVRKPTKVYPPPTIASEAVREATTRMLQEFADGLLSDLTDAAHWAREWDALKTAIRKEMLQIIKQRRKTARASYKQRMKRLIRQERRLRDAAAGHIPTVDTITDTLDVLTLSEGCGGTPLQRVRHAIKTCARKRASTHQRRLFQTGVYRAGKTTKDFFGRISTKYGDNEVHRLDAAIGYSARGVHDKADTLADAWTPIFQQPGSTEAERATLLKWLGEKGMYREELAELQAPVTEAEVAAAFGASKRGKACGPNRFGNDWYRDFGDIIIPLMTRLFNCWYPAGVYPASFLEADIFCLKKGGSSHDPLNFRSLAMLDTDYKLVTRNFATRTSKKLYMIIHPNQNGFVPFRTIHATVDLFTAAQAAAKADPAMEEALALLLDFMKAYDSVDRDFLYAVLDWLGFPPQYTASMRSLHEGTRVHFLANGYRSRWVQVTCGIRQGCPLAPLLFLLVLEALYRRIDSDVRIEGITLRSAAGTVNLKVGGYADDTASYVRRAAEVIIILAIARVFAKASGLQLNASKTLVIALNPTTAARQPQLPEPLKVQGLTVLSRYLGIPVGSIPDENYTWQLARTQLITRLALAARKTTTADQRSLVVMAIVIPKLLFIGRHQWPTRDIILAFQRMITNYVWHARFTDDTVTGRAWLNGHIAALPRSKGGLAIPDLKTELMALAAVTANNWAVEADTVSHIIGDVVAGNGGKAVADALYVTPRQTPTHATSRRMYPTLWTTGVRICVTHGGTEALPGKLEMVLALQRTAYSKGPAVLTWRGRRLLVDMRPLQGPLCTQYIATEAAANGIFCMEWLPYLSMADVRLYTATGRVVVPTTCYKLICKPGQLHKHVVHWKWVAHGGLLVTALAAKVTKQVQRQIAGLIRLLLLNYPQLTTRGANAGDVRYTTREEAHVQIVRRIDADRRLITPTADTSDAVRDPLSSHRELVTAMQTEVGTEVSITDVHPHPMISRMVCLWAGRRRWKTPRKLYKTKLRRLTTVKGIALAATRGEQWTMESEPAAAGLNKLAWKRIRRVVGLNPWGEQLLLRLKHHAVNLYDQVSAGLGCPHADCVRLVRIDLHHVFWGCPVALSLRQILTKRWSSAGLRLANFEEAIFSLHLPQTPAGITVATGRVVAELSADQVEALGEQIEKTTACCWSLGVAQYLLAVWRWRIAHFDAHNDVSPAYHTAGLANRLRTGHADVTRDCLTTLTPGLNERIGAIICTVLGEDWDGGTHGEPRGGFCYVVAVAGRAAGPDKPGSSGTVVIKVHKGTGDYSLLYACSATYPGATLAQQRTTNLGLLLGLQRCKTQCWQPVHVLGDHADVLRQHTTRKPPNATHLKGAYWRARRAADAVAVTSWTTQPREYNRTAAEFANLAQMTGRSMRWNAGECPKAGERWKCITDLITQDVIHWLHVQETTVTSEIATDPA